MNLQDQLKALLSYDPLTGVFIWRAANNRRIPAGSLAGCLNKQGYIRVDVLGKQYPAQRLAWLYVYGEWPPYQVDHINMNKADNRIENLRSAKPSENARNKSIRSDNTSGFKGVHKMKNRWIARCKTEKERVYLGSFKTPEEAHSAYQQFAKANHGEFFRSH